MCVTFSSRLIFVVLFPQEWSENAVLTICFMYVFVCLHA